MVVIRRFLLTGLGSPAVTTVAVVLTGNAPPAPSPPLASLHPTRTSSSRSLPGVEETLLRATLVERDVWAREVLFKGKPLTAEQTRRKKEIWACSINGSMVSPHPPFPGHFRVT